MTLKDDEKFCLPCKKIGLERKAHRIMPSGGGRCDEHFRDEQGLPQLNEEAKRFIEMCKARAADSTAALPDVPKPSHALEAPKPMRKKLDYKAIQADRDRGMKIADAAKKYGCSYASVAMNTHARTDPAPRGPYKMKHRQVLGEVAAAGKTVPKARPGRPRNPTVDGDFSAAIANLKNKRADYEEKITGIDEVIAALEKL